MPTQLPLKRSLLALALTASLTLPALHVLTAESQAAVAQTSQAAAPAIIIAVDQLEALQAAGAKVIDLRSARDYEAGHIPGAINLPWVRLNQREVDGIRNEFAEDSVIERELAAVGLNYSDTLVIYENSSLPGRAFAVLDYAGFEKLHVLDGGINAWKKERSTTATQLPPSNFRLTQKKEIRVNKAFVESRVGQAGTLIIDGRDEEAYLDGHIPGARNVPAPLLLTADRTLKQDSSLTQLLSSNQVNPDDEIVSYCGSGVYAANNYLALRNLGYQNVAFYDASWDEWSRDPHAGQSIAYDNYTVTPDSAQPVQTTADGIPVGRRNTDVPRLLDVTELNRLSSDRRTVIVDVRSPADYDWGHIPNSVNVFWDTTLNDDRTLKSYDELAEIYKAAGVTPDKHVVIYARGGYQLSHTYTALSLLGYKNVDFFTGKFEGWRSK